MMWLLLITWLATYSSVWGASVSLELYSGWPGAHFDVQLLEAVAGVHDSLYFNAASTLYSDSDSDWDDDDEEDDEAPSNLRSYKKVLAPLSPEQHGLVNLNLVNHVMSPRIKTHYDHYETDVKPVESKIRKQCSKDSFGEILPDPLGVWVKYGSKIYCSEQDLYALQTDSFSEPELSFDRVFGAATDAPLLSLYGSPSSDRFSAMFSTLQKLAADGRLRFVWRYTPEEPSFPLTGYGKTLLVKEKKKARVSVLGSLPEISDAAAKSPIYEYDSEKLAQISLNLAASVLTERSSKRFQLLTDALYNLPRYAPFLEAMKSPENLYEVSMAALGNEKKGASKELMGISINGAPVHRLETDLPHVTNKIYSELENMKAMADLGFSSPEARLLFTKFALLSAVKENEFRMGSAHSRYTIYKDTFDAEDPKSGGVVFFNNIETDPNYNLFSNDRHEVYVENASKLKKGQVPPLRENVHDLIFVLNFSNKNQLKVFFAMSKIILDNGIAHQLGILPLIDDAKDNEIARKFYHILEVGEQNEALAFLYKYYESSSESEHALLDLVELPHKTEYPQCNKTIGNFDLTEASVIVNGIVHDMRSPTWQSQMVNQISHDVTFLKKHIQDGTDHGVSLKALLYENAKSERLTKVIPKDPSNIRYKLVTAEMIANSISFKKEVNAKQPSVNFWLIGDFNSRILLEQLQNIFKFMRQYNGRSSQVRIINIAEDSSLMQEINKFSSSHLSSSKLRDLAKMIGDASISVQTPRNVSRISLLEKHEIQTHQPALLFNSRYLRLEEVLKVRHLEQLLRYENTQRLEILDEICSAYPSQLQDNSIMDFRQEDCPFDSIDWYDLVTSQITSSFNIEDSLVRTDVSRFDFSSLDLTNAIDVTPADPHKMLDILIVLDPVDEFSQRLLAIAESISDLEFVNLRVLIQPLSQSDMRPELNRLYASQFVPSTPKFSSDGDFVEIPSRKFEDLPETTVVADLDVPVNWQYSRGNGTDVVDLDSLAISKQDNIVANYTLTRLVVETFVRDVNTGRSATGLSLHAHQNSITREGGTLQTLGYNQMQLEPGLWQISVAPGSGGDFDLLSIDENKYIANDEPLASVELPIFSLLPSFYNARVRRQNARGNVAPKRSQADINIFSISRGHSYEKLMAIMMLSVKKFATSSVKFWLLEDYLSKTMQEQLPVLASTYGFEYELVSYKWPVWLRQQREPARTVWGFKILFLDVLFPSDLERVIFVDADQVARADLLELMTLDMGDAPYGFTPMCESRKEMEGFMFWKQGYWQNVLKDDLKYHISALFVVDLKQFRQQGIGEKLRSHYQKLSSDSSSLANLDQDLPNNLQRIVPIYSLPQDWLWCETWCSSESKSSAKMIDMCNNPTSSEGKLQKARRIVAEWDVYNKQLQKISQGELAFEHDEL